MATPSFSVAWLLVLLLLALLVYQNSELDFAQFACSSQSIRQLYDVLGFLFGHLSTGGFLSAADTDTLNHIVKLCGTQAHDQVLELGFGSGHMAKTLLEKVGIQRYDGVELSEAMVNVTSHFIKGKSRRHMFLLHSDDTLKLLDSSEALSLYSHAYALWVLDALGAIEIKQALLGFHARLQPGGRLCISTLADLPDHWMTQLYKTSWRIAPLLLGGRRPLSFQRLVDEQFWIVKDTWLDRSRWLPSETLVLERRPLEGEAEMFAWMKESNRVATLQRWSRHIREPGTSHPASSANQLPLGVMKDIVAEWMPQLSRKTLHSLVIQDIRNMSQGDIVSLQNRSLQQLPTVELMHMVREHVSAMPVQSLEEAIAPPIDHLSLEEMRMHVQVSLETVSMQADGGAELLGQLLQRRDAVSKMQTRDELLAVHRWLEQEVLVPTSELSREQMESAVIDNMNHMTREEVEDFLLSGYELADEETVSVLHDEMVQDVQHMSSEELQARAFEAAQHVDASVLEEAVIEVATSLLTEQDLEVLASASSEADASLASGGVHQRGGLTSLPRTSRHWRRDSVRAQHRNLGSSSAGVTVNAGTAAAPTSTASASASAVGRGAPASEKRHGEL